jgi:hypothetical protein
MNLVYEEYYTALSLARSNVILRTSWKVSESTLVPTSLDVNGPFITSLRSVIWTGLKSEIHVIASMCQSSTKLWNYTIFA